MSKKKWTVVISLGMILAMSITSMAAYCQPGYNSGTKTETVYVYANGTGTYTANAFARVEDASNNSLGYHEASAQNISVGSDHFSNFGRDY